MMKRVLITILTGMMICVISVGCASRETDNDNTSVSLSDKTSDIPLPETVIETTYDIREKNIFPIVGVVTYSGGIEDESFNQSAWEGLSRLPGEIDCDTKFYESDSGSDFESNMNKLIKEGGTLCWGIGSETADALQFAAEENPEIAFGIIDHSYDVPVENITCVVFRSEEPSFLAGFIAANITKTETVGFIGGMNTPVIDQFRYGYQAGVDYGSNKTGREIKIISEYTDSFSDPNKGKEMAEKLYNQGCDIIFHAAGATGIGVIEAARELDLYVIGVDKDQSYLAPDNVLTSVIKNVNNAIYTVSLDILGGRKSGGHTVSLGLSEDAVGISENHSLYSDELYEEVMQIREDIQTGKICPPKTKEEYDK